MGFYDKTKHVPSMDDFKTDNWKNLSPSERRESLQYLENKMAEEAGRKPRRIQVDKKLKPGECGYYDDSVLKRGNIYINEDYLYSNDRAKQYDAMDTVIHEGRHAYQYDCVNGRIKHSENDATLTSWGKNVEEYNPFAKDKTSYSYYRFQPIEDDANNYAATKIESYANNYSSDPYYQSYIEKTQMEHEQDANIAKNRLGDDYKQNIADDIYDRYDYKHKIGNYAERKNFEKHDVYSNEILERGQKRTSSEINHNSSNQPLERGQKPLEGENKPQGNNSTPRGELPQEPHQNASNASQTQRGRLPGDDSYSPTSSTSTPSNEVSASMNSAKAADEAAKIAAEESAKNAIPKPTGMSV